MLQISPQIKETLLQLFQQYNKFFILSIIIASLYLGTFDFLVTSVVAPAYLIYHSLCLLDLQEGKRDKSLDYGKLNTSMLKMWISYGCLLTFENVISFVHMPFYGIIKLLFLIWLYVTTGGAETFCDNYVYTQFTNHRELIDNLYKYCSNGVSISVSEVFKSD